MLDSIISWFEALGNDVNTLLYDVQYLVDSWIEYIRLSTYYIYISGALLVILFFMLCSALGKLRKLREYNETTTKELRDIKSILLGTYDYQEECENEDARKDETDELPPAPRWF